MVGWPKTLALALLPAGMLICGPVPAPQAAPSSTLDILSNDAAGDSRDTVDIGRVRPLARPNREAAKPVPGGNPLWSVPLSVLTATQERPIFSASRRPAQRAVVAPPEEQVRAPAPQKVAGPERPPLALVGAVVGDGDSIAIFFERTSQKIVRLRQGESHAGWILNSVQGREVVLTKDDRTDRRRGARDAGVDGGRDHGHPVPPSPPSSRVRRPGMASPTGFEPIGRSGCPTPA